MNITYEDLEKGKVKLEFGNMDQANILRKKEEEVAKLKKALKAPSLSMEYKDKTMYATECPHCGYESEHEFESEDSAFFCMTNKLSEDLYLCVSCSKRVKKI